MRDEAVTEIVMHLASLFRQAGRILVQVPRLLCHGGRRIGHEILTYDDAGGSFYTS